LSRLVLTIPLLTIAGHNLMIYTAAHYAAIHCPRQRTIGPAFCR